MTEPFKNLISPELVSCLSSHLARHTSQAISHDFVTAVQPTLESLELKDRVQLIADELFQRLPSNLNERHAILQAFLHPDIHSESPARISDQQGIAGWGIWPLSLIVGQRGVEDFDSSLALLREMTIRFTSEFAIRYFLLESQEKALSIIQLWTNDPNAHVRRLVSEGTRPRLPWAMQLPSLCKDPSPAIPLLEALKDDPSEYVRRSVANHLNDISKDNPAVMLSTANRWMKGASKERIALIKHGCRTQIKAGDPKTLKIFGFAPPKLNSSFPVLSKTRLCLGESMDFSLELSSTTDQPQQLVIDYLVFYVRANGQRSTKVFKGSTVTLKAKETMLFARTHTFRPISTRRHYAGQHAIAFRINGVDSEQTEFELII